MWFRNFLFGLWRSAAGSISALIVFVCLGLFLGITCLSLLHVVSWDQAISLLGLSYEGLIGHRRLYQLLTAPFVHAGLTHLAFNMLALWVLGPDIEYALGRLRYVAFSLVCATFASIGFLILDRGMGGICFGYSGVIFGILVAQAVLYPDRQIFIYMFFPVKMKYAVLVMGAVELYLTISPTQPGIAHSAHVFGALGALVWLPVLLGIARRGPLTSRRPAIRPGRTRHATPGEHSPRPVVQQEPAWLRPVTGAARTVGTSDFAAARADLRSLRAPRQVRALAGRLIELGDLLDGLDSRGCTAEQAEQLMMAARAAWDSAARARLPDALAEVARVAAEWEMTGMAARIAGVIGSPAMTGCSVASRERLESAMRAMGEDGMLAVLSLLAEAEAGDPKGTWLLDFLVGIQPAGRIRCLMGFYREADRARRKRLVERLCELAGRSSGALMEIIAAVLRTAPADHSLALAVRDQLGASRLREEAVKWAARDHAGSMVVLEMLLDADSAGPVRARRDEP